MHDALSRLRKRYEAQATLAALEEERKALMAQLGKQSGTAPAIAPPPAPTVVVEQANRRVVSVTQFGEGFSFPGCCCCVSSSPAQTAKSDGRSPEAIAPS